MTMPEQEAAASPEPGSGPALQTRSEALEAELGALEAMLPPESAPPAAARPAPGTGVGGGEAGTA